MADKNCVFCKMVAGQIPVTKIYEDKTVLAFLDIGPLSDGHTLVIPKEHFEKLHNCPAEVLGKIFSCLGKIGKAVADAMSAEGYNLLCNNGKAAGQLVNHLHFHIIPRNNNDELFNSWPSYKYKEGIIETIAAKICANL